MEPREDEVGALERARERLYKPTPLPPPLPEFRDLPAGSVPGSWAPAPERPHPHVRFALVFFVGAGVFFLAALGIAAYLFLTGANTVSTKNISVTIQGPTTIAAGDTVPLSLTIENRNPTPVTGVDLRIDFPAGTRSADDALADLPRYEEDLGTLPPGASVTRSVRAVIFGPAGATITLPVAVSFGAGGSNATFVKQASYALSITSAPLSLSVAALSEAVSGQPFSLLLTVRSNATTPIDDVVVVAQYPFGFSLTSASPSGVGTSFLLGTLAPGATKTIKLTGILAGTSGEQKAFRFSIGTATPNTSALRITYMTQEADVAVAAPFLAVTLSVNGDESASPVVNPASTVNASIAYTNTLTTPIENARITVALSGNGFDPVSVSATRGFYDSLKQSIVFDNSTDPSLAAVAPGASGVGAFSFRAAQGSVRNPSVTFSISVEGQRLGQSNVPESVTASVTKTARVLGAPSVVSLSTRATGPFVNTGPVPPVVNKATTYSILWKVSGSGNDLAGGTISAVLPTYVTFTNLTLPADGSIAYDEASRTVTWSVGELRALTVAQAAFQVSLTPSVNQRGTAPALASAPAFFAHDRFAGADITETLSAPTTETPSDPGYTASKADVQ